MLPKNLNKLPFRRAFSTTTKTNIGPSSTYIENLEKLQNPFSHFSQSQKTKEELDKCPFMSKYPELYNSALHESNARGYVRKFPIVIKKGQGCKLYTQDGREFYDLLNVAGTLAFGHNHPIITKSIEDFLKTEQPLQVLDLCTPIKNDFINSLLSVLPQQLNKLHFCSPAGTDSLDAAVKLCKIATGRRTVLAFHGAYHGMGQAPLALMGNLSTKSPVSGLMPDVHFAPYPYQYRPPFGIKGEEGEKAVMKYIETLLTDVESGIPKPACVILECIQGEGGIGTISDWSLRELRRITLEQDIPLIIDEVQSGFCRSGDFFSFQKSGIVPDVVMMSKALGGSMPMAVIAFNEKLNQWKPAAHTGTFRGNQLAFACGKTSIEYMKQEKLWEQVQKKGNKMIQRMLGWQKKSNERIGDIRGRGFMVGIECVDPSKHDHVGVPVPDGDFASEWQLECFKNGLILERGGRDGAVMRPLPPCTISEEDLNNALDIMEHSFDTILKKRS